jgi:hypothetical protein
MAKQTKIQPKKYVVIDEADDNLIICGGTLENIQIELENEYIDKMDHDWDTNKWLDSLTVYELTKSSKLKYTRAKLEIK